MINLSRNGDCQFSILANTNGFKHLVSTHLKNRADDLLVKERKINLTHDSLKKLREKINSGYKKNEEIVIEMIKKWFKGPNGEILDYKNYGILSDSGFKFDAKPVQQKSVLAMYNELYNKIELDENFKKNYEDWAEEELMTYLF